MKSRRKASSVVLVMITDLVGKEGLDSCLAARNRRQAISKSFRH
jgi:hypothetical protein